MIKSFRSDSGISISTDNIFQVIGGRIRAIQADETNDEVVIFLEEKDNSLTTNSGTSERIFLRVSDGKAANVAESIISALNGLPINSQLVDNFANKSTLADNVLGVEIPAFTFASTAVSIAAPVGPTLATATAGANFTYTITKDADTDVSLTKTGVIATADDALTFTATEMTTEGFVATDVCTVTVSLSVPTQPDSITTVTAAATLTS